MHTATTYLRLSELAEQIEDLINQTFYESTFWVVADVIDYKLHEQKGHHYFCLAEKDRQTHSIVAKISAAAWKNSGAVSIASFEQVTGQKFKSNIQVLANVTVRFDPVYGLKLILNAVDPTYTIGILEQHRRDNLQKLLSQCPEYIWLEGDTYRTRNKSLVLPPVLQRIAVVTSNMSEGFRDFKDTIEQNRFGYAITLDTYFTSVQGDANAEGVRSQLVDIFNSGIPYDAVIIIRGGGSQSDLLLFEQFILAQAVAKFPIPIITGIGHHINQSIVDLMAHTSIKTPSIAAEFIISHNHRFEESVLLLQRNINYRTQQLIAQRKQQLSILHSSIVNNGMSTLTDANESLTRQYQRLINSGRKALYNHQSLLSDAVSKLALRPRYIITSKQCELDNATHNLKTEARRYLTLQHTAIDHTASVINLLNPVNILKRGFAVIYNGAGVITDADNIGEADNISIRFYESKLTAIITSKTSLDGTIANL